MMEHSRPRIVFWKRVEARVAIFNDEGGQAQNNQTYSWLVEKPRGNRLQEHDSRVDNKFKRKVKGSSMVVGICNHRCTSRHCIECLADKLYTIFLW